MSILKQLQEQADKKYWYVYRKTDLQIIEGGFDTVEKANEIIMDLDGDGFDTDDYEVGLGWQVGVKFKK